MTDYARVVSDFSLVAATDDLSVWLPDESSPSDVSLSDVAGGAYAIGGDLVFVAPETNGAACWLVDAVSESVTSTISLGSLLGRSWGSVIGNSKRAHFWGLNAEAKRCVISVTGLDGTPSVTSVDTHGNSGTTFEDSDDDGGCFQWNHLATSIFEGDGETHSSNGTLFILGTGPCGNVAIAYSASPYTGIDGVMLTSGTSGTMKETAWGSIVAWPYEGVVVYYHPEDSQLQVFTSIANGATPTRFVSFPSGYESIFNASYRDSYSMAARRLAVWVRQQLLFVAARKTSDGTMSILVYDDNFAIKDIIDNVDGSSSTPSAPTLAMANPADPGDVDDGAHTYAVTFTDALGETAPGATAAITVNDKGVNGKVKLTAIAIGPAGTTARTVYRSEAGTTSPLKLLTTISDNTTTVYTDNTADSALGATPPTASTAAHSGQWAVGGESVNAVVGTVGASGSYTIGGRWAAVGKTEDPAAGDADNTQTVTIVTTTQEEYGSVLCPVYSCRVDVTPVNTCQILDITVTIPGWCLFDSATDDGTYSLGAEEYGGDIEWVHVSGVMAGETRSVYFVIHGDPEAPTFPETV